MARRIAVGHLPGRSGQAVAAIVGGGGAAAGGGSVAAAQFPGRWLPERLLHQDGPQRACQVAPNVPGVDPEPAPRSLIADLMRERGKCQYMRFTLRCSFIA
jgi:hypothetical protein